MNWLPRCLNVMFLLHSVLGALPVPSNLSVVSVNFHHILHWDPGPATPPGVQYKVFSRLSGKREKETQSVYTTATSLQMKLDKYKYYLTVQAFYNGTSSPESEDISFTPLEQTIIGPPKVILTEYNNSIQINISLPEADKSSGIPNNDILAFYKGKFRILWKKSNNIEEVHTTEDRSVTFDNLEKGKQYCVQIQIEITMNENTPPSAWVCTITRIPVPRRVPVFLGTTAGLLIFCIGALMALTYCLYDIGVLCKPQENLPRVLITTLNHANFLPVEETSPDLISNCSVIHKQKYTTALYPAHRTTYSGRVEEKVEEEEEESNIYINRDSGNSSGESTCRYSCDVFRTFLSVRSHTEADTSNVSSDKSALDQPETRVDNEDTMCRQPETEVEEQLLFQLEGETNEDAVNMSESVDLLSVTLNAIVNCKKEELNTEDSLVDSLGLSVKEPLLTATKQNLCHTDVQTDWGDLTSMKCTHFDETCYEYRCDDVETQEELEEKQFLAYIGR
ncbi:cytokine receptor family member b1 isoform X2 [Phycodurus eques]|nr:cytokine receptor family member b1 isoform X2 [Phycodurus eques]XP_061548250.1 cytokine receptor family member b1 isoform X2 [Phycodurus eques]XP_061548251.1 cytokine receptor family member b1 isoform X2 [Phycodurus eques]XP_061548252.1 cytokine receptor family member b1 isoform X2 [Phycodurus eques]